MPTFTLPRRIEAEYQAAIQRLLAQVTPLPVADIDAFVNNLAELSQRLDLLEIASKIASRMVTSVNVQNMKTWREAAHRSTRAQHLYRLLQSELQGVTGVRFREIVEENAQLISSVPADVAVMLSRQIAKGQQQGIRPATMAKAIKERFPELMTSRIKLIARTEAAKANSALTVARQSDLNLPWFAWSTSEDQRVRPSHRKMDGVLVSNDELPSPERLIGQKSSLGAYGPGECPNCRCVRAVMLSLDDFTWPRRVYAQGALRLMTRGQFQRMTGVGERLAA